jgi:hypothetical protein
VNRVLVVALLAGATSACASSQCQQWNLTDAFGITGPTPQVCPGGQPTVTRDVLDRIKGEYVPKG